jgi:hypothetical protein
MRPEQRRSETGADVLDRKVRLYRCIAVLFKASVVTDGRLVVGES